MNTRRLLVKQLQQQQQSKSYSIEERINKRLLRDQSPREPDGKIHPSQIGDCPRYIFFFMKKLAYTNYTPHSAQLQRIFDVGKDHEVRVKKRLKAINILVAVDVPIAENPMRVKGTADAIVYIDDKYFVVEIKTANDGQFKYHVPHKKYKYQCAAYMYFLDIPDGKIYYSNKNDQTEVEIEMDINDPIVTEMLELVRQYNYNFDNNIVPDVQHIRPKCSATSCWYYNQCMKYPEQAVREG